MSETETATREVQQLRRCLRDLVALSALPAVWVGYDPRQIAESLADGLRHMLNLDLVYLVVRDRADGIAVEVAHTPQGPAPADRVQEIRRVLDPWLKPDPPGLPSSIRDPLGNGDVPIVLNPFGSGASGGVLVAGSRRADFPTEVDRLLLGVGANQVAILLDRRRAEEALRESEQRFRTFVDHATDAFFLHDDRLVVLDVNRQACQSLGYTRDELVGMTPLDFDPDVTPAMLEEIGGAATPGRRSRSNPATGGRTGRCSRSRSGAERSGRAAAGSSWPWPGTSPSANGWRRSCGRPTPGSTWRSAAPTSGSGKSTCPTATTPTGVGTWINVWEQLGLEPPADRSPFVDLGWISCIPTTRNASFARSTPTSIGETKEYEIEYRVRHKDGTYRWMLARGTAIRDQAGKPIRLVGSRVDITELKRVEEVLRESEAWFRFLAKAMPQIVWTARPDGSPDYFNDRFVEYTGLPVAEVTGEGWLSVLHPDDRERTMTSWMAVVATGSDHDIEYRLRAADGRYRWHLAAALPLRDESGRITKWFGTSIDIDDQKRAEEALRRGQGGGGGGEPGQGRVPGQRQPRDPHPHERHPRHDRAGPRHARLRRAAAIPDDRQVLGRCPAEGDQRPARLLQDRGRQARARPRRLLAAARPGGDPAGAWPCAPTRRGWSWSARSSRRCPTP